MPPAPNDADDLLLRFVSDRDAACPACGYSLRGLTTARCPECAGKLFLSVGSENLALGPWFVVVLSLAMALGFDGVVGFVLSGALFFRPPPVPAAVQQVTALIGAFVALAGACGVGLWWVFARKKSVWNRFPLPRQRRIAAIVFVVVFAIHAAFGAYVLGI